MGLSIKELKASLSKYPLLDLSKYEVMITGPLGTLDREISLRCTSVVLPGRGFSTTELFTHGPVRKIHYMELYDDIQLSFIASDVLKERDFFNQWQRLMSGNASWNMAWYEEIIGTVVINNLDKQGNVKTSTTLFEAYPISMDPLTFDYTAGDQLPLFNVSFTYHHWEVKGEQGEGTTVFDKVPEGTTPEHTYKPKADVQPPIITEPVTVAPKAGPQIPAETKPVKSKKARLNRTPGDYSDLANETIDNGEMVSEYDVPADYNPDDYNYKTVSEPKADVQVPQSQEPTTVKPKAEPQLPTQEQIDASPEMDYNQFGSYQEFQNYASGNTENQ